MAETKFDPQALHLSRERASPEGSLQGYFQAQPAMQGVEITDKQISNAGSVTVCSDHFKYISTMSSFDDFYFKKTVKKELLKDRDVTWKAFRALSPASAWLFICKPLDGH